MLREIPEALANELRLVTFRGARGIEAAEASLSVTLAVLLALALHSDNPWWAGISAFMVTRASLKSAVSRGLMRVTGSAVGAVIGLAVLHLFAYQAVPFCLCLFVTACIGFFGFAISRYSYAWLIGAVTANLVMLMAFMAPQGAFTIAVDRVADVIIGTAASLVVCGLMRVPEDTGAVQAAGPIRPPPLAFWRRRFGEDLRRWLDGKWPLVLHAGRGGITVMLLPALATWLAPVSPVTMGLTAVIVMAIPTTAIIEADTRLIIQRAFHRLIGCLVGALAGIACLAVVGSDFLLWTVMLLAGTWLCSQIQTGTAGISYVGTQAMFAFVMSLVQSEGPPETISPGLDRLVGVAAGLALLFLITLILSLIPLPQPAAVPSAGADD